MLQDLSRSLQILSCREAPFPGVKLALSTLGKILLYTADRSANPASRVNTCRLCLQARSHEEHTSAFLGPSFSQRLDEVAAEEEGGIEPADEENQPESEEGGDHLGSGEENQLKPTEETHPETAKKEGQPKPAATPHPKPAQEQVPQPRSPIRSERYAEHWPKGMESQRRSHHLQRLFEPHPKAVAIACQCWSPVNATCTVTVQH